MQVPQPNQPVDIGGVTMDPEARQILFDAGITDAATQNLIATLIVRNNAAKLRDQFWGCLHIGTLAPDPYQPPFDYGPKNPQKLPAMVAACTKMIVNEAEKASVTAKPMAIASQAGCKLLFFPIFKSKKESKSAKRRRQIASAAKKAITGGCAGDHGELSFALRSKRKGVPLHKLTGRKLSAQLVRVAPKGTPTPPNAKMYVHWR
jgi:hypothetical protein